MGTILIKIQMNFLKIQAFKMVLFKSNHQNFLLLFSLELNSPRLEASFQGVRHNEKAAFGVQQTWTWIPAVTY